MSQNEQIVEVVTFTANGLEQMATDAKALADNTADLKAKYGEYAGAVEKAARRNELFARAVRDGSYERHVRQMRALNDQYERLRQRADGTADLKAKYGEYAGAVEKAARRNELFTRAVRDGSYERHVRQMRALNDQYERLRQRADAIARYGPRLGALVDNRAVQAAGRIGLYAGGAALAAGAGLARSGLSGTVEGNRLGLETQLLGREVAGAMKPFTDGVTNATMRVRKWMESLSGTEQDMLMYGGALVAGTVALRALLGANAFGALAGGAAGLAGRALGLGGAAGAGSSAATLAAAGAGGAAAAGGRGLLARGAGFLARNASKVPLVGAAVGGATSGDYGRFRAQGMGRGKAAFASLFLAGGEMVQSLTGDTDDLKKWREQQDKKYGLNDHRAVTLADAGFESVGSGYDRLSTSLALVDASAAAARESAAGTAAAESTGLIAAMERLAAAFAAAAADPMPRPASGTGGT